jgi:hypothetical protein
MADHVSKKGDTSKQKAEYVGHSIIKRANSDYLELKYKRLDGSDPGKELTTGAFVASVDEESKKVIKAKGVMVLTKTCDGKFWNLTKAEPESAWVEKKPYNPDWRSRGSAVAPRAEYNNAGIKVGAVLHDAVALAGKGAKISEVKTIAEQLLNLSYELEENVNSGKYKPSSNPGPLVDMSTGELLEEDEEPEDF